MSNRLSEQQAVQLQGALSKGIDADDCESTKATRDLVQTVTVFRGPTRPSGVTVEIAERLTALLHEPIFPSNVRGVWGKIVAREVLGPTTTKTTTKTKNWPIEWPSVFCVREPPEPADRDADQRLGRRPAAEHVHVEIEPDSIARNDSGVATPKRSPTLTRWHKA